MVKKGKAKAAAPAASHQHGPAYSFSIRELQVQIESVRHEMHEAARSSREDYARALELQNSLLPLRAQLAEAQATTEQCQRDLQSANASIEQLNAELATSREQAVPLCEAMRRQGLIHPVGEPVPFTDSSTLYRFIPQPTVS